MLRNRGEEKLLDYLSGNSLLVTSWFIAIATRQPPPCGLADEGAFDSRIYGSIEFEVACKCRDLNLRGSNSAAHPVCFNTTKLFGS